MPGLGFDLPGLLRRIRRSTDLSQRDLAARIGTSKSAIAAAETGASGLDARALAAAACLAGLRIALLDGTGTEVAGMDPDAVRDRSGRRFPAHLDTMLSEERGWRWEHRPRRSRPTYTFDRRRPGEEPRSSDGRPADHLLPRPGDSPAERSAHRRITALRDRAHERERQFLAGELAAVGEDFTCTCPAACDELDDWSGRPVHAEDCPCTCDVG
jgi:HTH-type transcriptional regulator/antitoxin HipB